MALLLLSTANYLKSNAAALAAGNFAHALLPALSLRTIKGLVHPKTEILPSFTLMLFQTLLSSYFLEHTEKFEIM